MEYTRVSLLRASPVSRLGTNRKLLEVAHATGRTTRQVACGLEDALWEAGPNPITDFADALEFEGKPKMASDKEDRWKALGKFREALTEYLSGKNAAFVGGVAVRSYGGRTGATLDMDILIDPKLLKETTRFLEKEGGSLTGSEENSYHFRIKDPDLDVDVRVAKGSLDEAALGGAKRACFQGRKLKIVLPGDLAAMKVKAYSERKETPQGKVDREDVLGLLRVGATTEQDVRRILKKYRPDLLPQFEEILNA
jgi:hypothetical protein